MGARTEIDYLNGFLVRWRLELGVDCRVSEMMARMIIEEESLHRF
jgi:ketopantoate reductase